MYFIRHKLFCPFMDKIQILKNEDESRSMILKPHGEKYEKIVKELGLC